MWTRSSQRVGNHVCVNDGRCFSSVVLTIQNVTLTHDKFFAGMAAKFVVPPCDSHMFDSGVGYCLSDFNRSMETSGYQDRCPWPTVKR